MKMTRWIFLVLCVGLISACSNAPRISAPVVDRAAIPAGSYRVMRGDTLNRIAARFGQRQEDLIVWNQINNPNNLSVGQILRVQRPGALIVGSPSDAMAGAPLLDSSVVIADHKTLPQGEKQPYSEQALATMQAAPTRKTVAPAQASITNAPILPAASMAAPLSADMTLPAREIEGVNWVWPTSGSILGAYQGRSKGIDIGGQTGQKIVATADGKVMFAGNQIRGYGNLVIIKHTETLQSVYAHNSRILVKEGQGVTRGQPVAEMGNTDSDQIKLHFEVRRQGKPVDPARFLPTR